MTNPRDRGAPTVALDDEEVAAIRRRLVGKQFYLCLTERVNRDGDPDADLKPQMRAHFEWLIAREREGVLFAAGPHRDRADPAFWQGDGMIILRAESREAAAAIAATCPFHRAGIRNFRIIPWLMNEGCFQVTLRYASGSIEIG
jgi:uncharacterized protein YciI